MVLIDWNPYMLNILRAASSRYEWKECERNEVRMMVYNITVSGKSTIFSVKTVIDVTEFKWF